MMIRRLSVFMIMVGLLSLSMVAMAQSCDDFTTGEDAYDEALAKFDDGFLQDAIDALSCAIEFEPENWDYWNQRGIYREDAGDYDLAMLDYNTILESEPEAGYAWNNRGNIHYYLGQIENALDDYEQAIAYDEIPDIPYYNRSLIYYEQGEYELAESDLLQSIEFNSEYNNSYLMLAIVYTRLNDEGQEHYYFAEWIDLNTTETIEDTLAGSVDGAVYDMVEGREYRFAFEGTAGQEISISAQADSSADVDPLLIILDENGFPIMSDDDSGVNLNAVISQYALPEEGAYTLILSHAGGGSTGDVTLTVDLGEEGGIEIVERFATFNLFVNDLAEVYTTGGDRLNVRSGPGLDFDVVFQLDPGSLVTLLEGPRKVDGYAWWNIRDEDGNVGWSVERVDEEQTLQLALLVGDDAVITTGGDKLNVRTGAGTGNDLAFQIDEGARVTLLEVPEVANGFRWWKIRTEDGQEGWTIDRFDGDRMLIPAREVDS